MTNQYNFNFDTERLTVRQIQAEDWDNYYQLHVNQEVLTYVCDPLGENGIKERFEGRLPAWDKESSQWLCLIMYEKETGKFVGVTGFFPEWEPCQQAEVGFMLMPEFYGKGYATESLRNVVHFAFEQCDFHKLTAAVTEGNDASKRVLEKCHFQLEGVLRDNFKIADVRKDDLIYGLLKTDLSMSS